MRKTLCYFSLFTFKANIRLRPNITAHSVQKSTPANKPAPNAISAQLDIDTEKCNGCRECKIACYMSAIGLRME
ncbi:4Fe-4S binding protein [Actinobacillus porcitonsillarum]|uniref:4Fe-4S binding protein n=1 Tax=Actinobacillus porcitonsillarum TaxID=189834 RepID=UPI003B82F2EA